MDELLSEKEQLEQIRSWWSEYGGYVIGGLGLGIAILAGLNWYENSKFEAQLASSTMYETLTEHAASGSVDEAEVVANTLGTDYPGTSYAAQAKLTMARLYMDRNRDQDAATALQELLDSDADDELKFVARSRLARVLLYQGKAQEVVSLLEGQSETAFAATYQELLGDAYAELGRTDEARAAYEAVLLDPMSQATVDQQLVQWKLLDLAEPAAAEASPVDEPMVDEPIAEEPSAEELPAEEPSAEEPVAEDAVETSEAEGGE